MAVKYSKHSSYVLEAIKCAKVFYLITWWAYSVIDREEGTVPQNMRDCNIYKWNRSNWKLQRKLPAEHHQEGLCPCGLKKLAERVYSKSQCGFRLEHSSPFKNYRRNAENRDNHCTLLSSTAQKHSILWAETAYTRYSTGSVVFQEFSRLSNNIMQIIGMLYNLATLSISAAVWHRFVCLHVPYWAFLWSCWNMC